MSNIYITQPMTPSESSPTPADCRVCNHTLVRKPDHHYHLDGTLHSVNYILVCEECGALYEDDSDGYDLEDLL